MDSKEVKGAQVGCAEIQAFLLHCSFLFRIVNTLKEETELESESLES